MINQDDADNSLSCCADLKRWFRDIKNVWIHACKADVHCFTLKEMFFIIVDLVTLNNWCAACVIWWWLSRWTIVWERLFQKSRSLQQITESLIVSVASCMIKSSL